MDAQMVINSLIMLVAFFGGWFVRVLWSKLGDLEREHKGTNQRLNGVEILVAGQYIRRDEFETKINALFNKLDKIEDKIDSCRVEKHDSK